MTHKSGFVSIVGRPNVGKSTLMNALVGEKLSIITPKPQTTRHRIIGIVNEDDYQIVFSDTPGIIEDPGYKLQELMNSFVESALEDSDLLLFMTQPNEVYAEDAPIIEQLKKVEIPKFLIVNKIDKSHQAQVQALIDLWQSRVKFDEALAVSALHAANTTALIQLILKYLPEGPPYYPKDQLTDRPERFFVAEIIREKIFEQFQQEIPYSTEVHVESFKETETKSGEPLIRIHAFIYVERESQKAIMLGHQGKSIKQLGAAARKALEQWLETKVFLDLHLKVREKWRKDEQQLKRFGYK
ncbi:MAG: GTPase Era [Bacteroidetes bacterium]|nr:MAG: GTPase Era [Bacteroidota bacterium]